MQYLFSHFMFMCDLNFTGPENISSTDFIKEGWSRQWNKIQSHSNEIIVGKITIKPNEDLIKDNQVSTIKFLYIYIFLQGSIYCKIKINSSIKFL